MDSKDWNEKFKLNPIMYSDIGRLWKYIKPYINEPYSDKIILDIGCGIGGNSFFFLEKGFFVDAFDYSVIGTQFAAKLGSEYINSKFQIYLSSISDFKFNQKYNLIIAIAVLHFLNSQNEVENYIDVIQSNTFQGGLNIISFPIDSEDNDYDYNTIINYERILKLYKNNDWEIFDKLTGVTIGADPEGNNSRLIFLLIARKI